MLLHLTTPATWRVALSAGSVVTPSLVTDGFIHLSPPDQVRLPADRLFAGRDDVLLLVIDPDRLTDEVRWEPGVPTDPASMRFPHLFGPLPVCAVTSVLPYRPGPDGHYAEPVVPAADDLAGRARVFDRSLALRRSPISLPTATGSVALDPRVAHSHEHNSLWVDGELAATWVADADVVLAGCATAACSPTRPDGPLPAGWTLEEERLMVLGPGHRVPARRRRACAG